MIELKINDKVRKVEAPPDTPLLWVLRDYLAMTGTKFGCGVAQCGACTVHIDGVAVRSCQLPLEAIGESSITTIEGLAPNASHPLQEKWVQLNVPQCGYCQSGMLMAAAALLSSIPKPTDEDIDNSVNNICRCGTYPRVRRAIREVAAEMAET